VLRQHELDPALVSEILALVALSMRQQKNRELIKVLMFDRGT